MEYIIPIFALISTILGVCNPSNNFLNKETCSKKTRIWIYIAIGVGTLIMLANQYVLYQSNLENHELKQIVKSIRGDQMNEHKISLQLRCERAVIEAMHAAKEVAMLSYPNRTDPNMDLAFSDDNLLNFVDNFVERPRFGVTPNACRFKLIKPILSDNPHFSRKIICKCSK